MVKKVMKLDMVFTFWIVYEHFTVGKLFFIGNWRLGDNMCTKGKENN